MRRLLLMVATAYGVHVSRTATRNIVETARRARLGDVEARYHFTQTRYARVLGVRNSDLGLVYYSVVGVAATSGLISQRWVLRSLLLASGFSLGMSLYLLWALAFRLRVVCPICLKGHAVNVTVFGLLLAQLKRVPAHKP